MKLGRRSKQSKGIAVLEAAALLFIGLPLLIGLFSVFEIFSTITNLNNLTNNLISQNKIKPFILATGDQIWALRPIDYGSDASISNFATEYPRYLQAFNEHHKRIDEIIIQAETGIKKILGSKCKADCQKLYRAELRMVDIRIETREGRIRGGGIICEGRGEGEKELQRQGCKNGTFKDLKVDKEQKQHRYLRIRGGLKPESEELRHDLYQVVRDANLIKELGIPSGLHATKRNQYYGSSPTLDGSDTLNYSPVIRVVGLKLEVDLAQTLAGKFLKLVRYVKATRHKLNTTQTYQVYNPIPPCIKPTKDCTPLTSNDIRMRIANSSVDAVISAQNYVIPKNDL